MKRNILDHYADKNTPFLHGEGESGTEHLLAVLDLRGKEKVLEIGFGTGATQVKLKSRYPQLDIHGIERSPLMLQKARQRMTWAGLSSQQLLLDQGNGQYPFETESLDLVLIESVLGILSQQAIEQVLAEVGRMLKPQGIWAINETMWLPGILPEEMKQINEECERAFGIIQAQAVWPTIKDWTAFVQQHGFEVVYCAEAAKGPNHVVAKGREWRSKSFSYLGRFFNAFNVRMRKESREIQSLSSTLFSADKAYLKSYVLKLCKV